MQYFIQPAFSIIAFIQRALADSSENIFNYKDVFFEYL